MRRRHVTPRQRFAVLRRDAYRCQYCGRGASEVVLEVDHVWPYARGGDGHLDNLSTACRDCNRGKGSLDATPTETDAWHGKARLERERRTFIVAAWRAMLAGLPSYSDAPPRDRWGDPADLRDDDLKAALSAYGLAIAHAAVRQTGQYAESHPWATLERLHNVFYAACQGERYHD